MSRYTILCVLLTNAPLIRTESTFCEWTKRYILFHDKRHPSEMGAPEIESFLTYLSAKRKVSASPTEYCALFYPVFIQGGTQTRVTLVNEFRQSKTSTTLASGANPT